MLSNSGKGNANKNWLSPSFLKDRLDDLYDIVQIASISTFVPWGCVYGVLVWNGIYIIKMRLVDQNV